MEQKLIITLWQNFYDYDGLTSDFQIFDNNFLDIESAKIFIDKMLLNLQNKELKENHKDWGIMEVDDYKKRPLGDVNKKNNIVYSKQMKIGDGTGYNSIYYYFDIIALDAKNKLEPSIFNLKDCEFEVKNALEKYEAR